MPNGPRRLSCSACVARIVTPRICSSSPGPDLDDVVEAAASQQGAGPARHDESRGTSEQPERREIEVVVVDMRDEHHIGPMLVEPESGADALQVEHPRA